MCLQGMVCKVVDSVKCIIRDFSGAQHSKKRHIVELAPDTPVRDLINEVANYFSYEPDSISLVLQRPGTDEDIVLTDKTPCSLEDAGLDLEPESRNSFSLMGHGNNLPVLRVSPAVEDDLSLGASASPTGTCNAESSDYPPAPPLPPPLSSSSTARKVPISEIYSSNYSQSLIKHDIGYVGLVNQAMTCYLNSLLQALYMTPEFRNALYKWEFDGNSEEAKSIPFQLQKLFLNLQTSKRNAVETTELTRSFGWDSSEAWQQHDIQELCRVMFDALEHVLKDTQQADLIDRLYQGKMIDYVKCLECSQEKSRKDTFLDIPLPVRPFGSSVAYGSVEEALRAFVQPETLEGNNQYHCDQCSKKCDAHKGLKFSKFPYLLTLHLKRFDFDYSTMHRIKLNDKVVFPEILDLNSFIQQEKDEGSEGFPEELAAGKCDDSSTTDSGSALDDESCQGANELSQTDTVQEDDEGIDVSGGSSTGGGNNHENEKNRQHTMQKGPYLYELFSIMIHSGSASGGHYYAYIKEFSNGQWFCFNDQTVTRITNDDIAKTYGGGSMRGYYSGAYSSSTNAYMLMYRQIDKDCNCDAMTVEEFPPHIKELYKRLQEREEIDRRMKEQELEMCKIKLYSYQMPPFQSNSTLLDTKLFIPNDMTLSEATEHAYKTLKLEGVVPIEQCRLVSYNKMQDTIEVSFEGREDEPLVKILNSLRTIPMCDLLMEIRNKNQKFIEYQPGGIALRVFFVDLDTEEVDGPTQIRGHYSYTIGELKNTIGTTLNKDPSQLMILYEKYSELNERKDDSRTLNQENMHSLTKIFVCDCPDDPDIDTSMIVPRIRKIVERFENTITLQIALPDTSPETLNSLSIPMFNSPSAASSNSNIPASLTNNDTPTSTSTSTPDSASNRQRLKKGNNCTGGVASLPVGAGGTGDTGGGNSGGASSLPIGTGGTGDTGGGGGSRNQLLLPLLLTGNNTNTTCTISAANATANVIASAAASVTLTTASTSTTVSTTVLTTSSSCMTSNTVIEAEETGSQGAGGGDQSTSEDSSLTDSDRTLIGDVPDDYPTYNHTDVLCTTNNDEYEQSSSNLNRLADNSKFKLVRTFFEVDNNLLEDEWREEEESVNTFTYFKATPCTGENDQKMLSVQVDKRMLLGYLKTCLEPFVGVPAVYFRIYRMYPGQQEYECVLLKDNLTVYKDNEHLSIKLGRALRGGEHRVKVYQLAPNSNPPTKFLCDWIIAKGQTVSETKIELIEDLNKKNIVKIPLDRCRLRRKNWKSPVKAYLDNQVWGSDVPLESNTDIFLQELPGPEIVNSTSQMLLFIRQWFPSKYQLGPYQEIVLNDKSISELKSKISEVSEIPEENIEFTKPPVANFPYEVSLLLVHELDWSPHVGTIDLWPLQISEDGNVLYFRDNREELKQLTSEEKKEITSKENAKRNGPTSSISSYSPRKERPLKIYLDSTPRRPRAIVEPDID